MSKFVLPSRVDNLTKVGLPGLQFEYKNHHIRVELGVELRPEGDGCILWNLHLVVNEKHVDIWKLDKDLGDEWNHYSLIPVLSFTNPHFAKLVKKILNKYLKETI